MPEKAKAPTLLPVSRGPQLTDSLIGVLNTCEFGDPRALERVLTSLLLMDFLNTTKKCDHLIVHIPMGRFGEAVEQAKAA